MKKELMHTYNKCICFVILKEDNIIFHHKKELVQNNRFSSSYVKKYNLFNFSFDRILNVRIF